ncbi:LOW QUALITY PROTEIN: hypothetical protein HID58_071211, partial [Brassica napus]
YFPIDPLPSHWEKWNKGKGLQLTDSPLRTDGSPQSSLYYCSEESWLGFTEWVKKPTPLPLGPSILNLSIATRIVSLGKWLGNESCCDCGAYALKHLECNLLGIDLSLLDDAANDPIYAEAMTRYVPSPWEREENSSGENLEIDPIMSSANSSSTPTDRAMMKGHESRIEEMEDAIAHCEEKITECIRELRIIKALFVCCLAMVFMYLAYA